MTVKLNISKTPEFHSWADSPKTSSQISVKRHVQGKILQCSYRGGELDTASIPRKVGEQGWGYTGGVFCSPQHQQIDEHEATQIDLKSRAPSEQCRKRNEIFSVIPFM